MAIAVAQGIYDGYHSRPGHLRYGADDAGPPVRYQHGRFVEYSQTPAGWELTYGDDGGVYGKYNHRPWSLTYGP